VRCTSVHRALTAAQERSSDTRVTMTQLSQAFVTWKKIIEKELWHAHHQPPRRRRAPLPAEAQNVSRSPQSTDSGLSALHEPLSNLHGVTDWPVLMKDCTQRRSNLLSKGQLFPCFVNSSLLQNALHSSGVGFGVGSGVGAGSHTFCHTVKPCLFFCLLQFL